MQLQPIIDGLLEEAQQKVMYLVPAARLRLVAADGGFKVHAPQFSNGLELDPVGKTLLCRTLKMSENYFETYPMPEEFNEHVATLLRDMGEEELLVRVFNNKVMTIVQKSFQILDDHTILQELQPVFDSMHLVPDVEVVKTPGVSDYRFRLGRTRRMLRVRNTELGVGGLNISLGIRFQDGAIMSRLPSQGSVTWSHRGSDPRVVDAARMRIRAALSEGEAKWVEIENELEEKRSIFLGLPPADVVDWMVKNQVLNASFAKSVIGDLGQGPDPIPSNPQAGLNWHEFVLYLCKIAALQPNIDQRFKVESNPFFLAVKRAPW